MTTYIYKSTTGKTVAVENYVVTVNPGLQSTSQIEALDAFIGSSISRYDDGILTSADTITTASLALDAFGNVTGLVGPGGVVVDIGGGIDIRNWCVADGVVDDSASFLTALTDANGTLIRIPTGVSVNMPTGVTYTGPVNICGDGTIKHTRRGVLSIKPGVVSLGSVSSTATVSLPAGYAQVSTSKLTLASTPPASVIRGSILLLSSDDPLPEKSGAYLAELVRVQDVSGNDITLSELLEFPYTTNIVVHQLKDNAVNIQGITFTNPNYLTENNGQAAATLYIEACVNPVVKCNFRNQATAALQFGCSWMPDVDVVVNNSRNAHLDESYGYGIVIGSATAHGRFKIKGTNNRHTFTGGAGANTIVTSKGPTRRNYVYDSESIAPLSAGFDTHEGMYHTTFVNCIVKKQIGNVDYQSESVLFDFTDRGAGSQFVNCMSQGHGGIRLSAGEFNRLGTAGKYTTRVINHVIDADLFHNSNGINIAASYNSTVAGYHEIEFINCSFRKTQVYITTGAPRVTIDGMDLRESDGAIQCGGNNFVTLRNIKRRRVAGALPNLLIQPGTTLVIDGYTAEATSFSGNILVYASGGAGTATVKWGRPPTFISASPPTFVGTDGTTVASVSLLTTPLRPIVKGTTASRPVLGSWEIGQQYLDTTLAANGKPITWNGSVWTDSTGASV